MMLVRNCFTAKPGQASKLAAVFKDMATSAKIPNHRVLTDVVGDFNQVVFEFEVENLAAVDGMMQKYMSDPAVREKMQGYTDLYASGRREVMKVV